MSYNTWGSKLDFQISLTLEISIFLSLWDRKKLMFWANLANVFIRVLVQKFFFFFFFSSLQIRKNEERGRGEWANVCPYVRGIESTHTHTHVGKWALVFVWGWVWVCVCALENLFESESLVRWCLLLRVRYFRMSVWERKSSGQSYKGSTIVNYSSRVVIWDIFKYGTTLGLQWTIDRRTFIRLTTGMRERLALWERTQEREMD